MITDCRPDKNPDVPLSLKSMVISKKFLKELFWTILFCLGGSFVLTYFTCVPCRQSTSAYITITFVSASIWFSMWTGNGLLADYTSTKISWTAYPIRRLIVGIVGTVVYSTSAIVVLTFLWNFILNNRYGSYYEVIVISLSITFVISLVLHSRAFLIGWKASHLEAEKFKRESIQARYDSLKSQVNPHFLFNSLNALTSLVYEDQDKAAKFIKQLSEVYRYLLDTRDREMVPMDQEMKFIESYLFLQKIRFGEKLRISISLTNERASVAPLAVQMLIENAIKHNVISEEDPLIIRVYTEGRYIVVENNLNKKSVLAEESSGLGLENIRHRYEFLSKQKIMVEDSNGKFIVRLPLLQTE